MKSRLITIATIHWLDLLTGATSGAGFANPFGAPELTQIFVGIVLLYTFVALIFSVALCVHFCLSLLVCVPRLVYLLS